MRGSAAFFLVAGLSSHQAPFTGRYWWWYGRNAEGAAV
jgi:hypothetical protein